MIESLSKLGMKENSYLINGNKKEAHRKYYTSCERLNPFFLTLEIRQECPFSPLWFSIILAVLAGAIKQGKDILKSIQSRKEATLFVEYTIIIVCVQNPKNFTKKLLEGELSKITGHKRSTQKVIVTPYTRHANWKLKLKTRNIF